MRTAKTNALDALSLRANGVARGWRIYCARLIVVILALVVAGCATVPGADYPKQRSTALDHPESTALGQKIDEAERAHPGLSGFRLLTDGAEGLVARAKLAEAAKATLDLQYFIVKNDVTGKLVMDGILRAADRGVRVRMLLDDSDDLVRNAQIIALAAHPRIQIRIFNPYHARGLFDVLRYPEFIIDARLNYRMHNKVFVADNAAAVIGGRNIGDDYFAASAHTDRADMDVLAVGPIVQRISRSFDWYWNDHLSIPVQALLAVKPGPEALSAYRAELEQNRRNPQTPTQLPKLEVADPVHALLDGDGSLVWAKADLLFDNPDKEKVEAGEKHGPLLRDRLAEALQTVHQELLMVSPYLVPAEDGMKLLEKLRANGVRVRIITNSLASTDIPAAHSGYEHYRVRLLKDGVELYEVKRVPEADDGESRSLRSGSGGQFSLHAKVFVLDRQRLFIGSMNFDYRSLKLNTEIGLLIDSPELAGQIAQRFEAIAQPANCYIPYLTAPDAFGHRHVAWRTEENGKPVELATEPMGDIFRGLQASLLSLLPLDDLL
jgi:cardiolipin synthase C